MAGDSLLHGSSVTWVTCDPQRTLSAALQWMLRDHWGQRPVRLEVLPAQNWEEVPVLVEQHRAGLLTLVVDGEHLAAACRALLRVRARRPDCVRLVYAPQALVREDCSLAEAGAQIVVSDIPCLQRLVPTFAPRLAMQYGGYHPLTAGLLQRLPWGHMA
jgi:hypothetical protein